MEQARELLKNFAEYLRRSFDFKEINQYVPLKNELELARAYSEIEMARFEERLTVSFEVPDNAEYQVPILVLQPILENAIIHGVLPKQEGGHVSVVIKTDHRQLYFTVKDDGVGMEWKGKLPASKAGSGVGLDNIAKRLKKLFGKGLNITSSPGTGTEVSWIIPIRERRH